MKKTLVLGLLLLVAALSCMLPVRYGVKLAARIIMLHSEHEEDATFTFTEAELAGVVWENNHEFRLHGQLYDVEETDYDHGTKRFHCVVDVWETSAEQKTDDAILSLTGQHRDGKENNTTIAVLVWLQSLYFQVYPVYSPSHHLISNSPHYALHRDFYSFDFLRLPVIPPEA